MNKKQKTNFFKITYSIHIALQAIYVIYYSAIGFGILENPNSTINLPFATVAVSIVSIIIFGWLMKLTLKGSNGAWTTLFIFGIFNVIGLLVGLPSFNFNLINFFSGIALPIATFISLLLVKKVVITSKLFFPSMMQDQNKAEEKLINDSAK